MREIELRAWDKNRRKMIFGPTDDNPNASWVLALAGLGVPIMQFIGIKDKNGKKIYDDDIIQDDGNYPDGVKYRGVVRFGDSPKMPCGYWSDTSFFGTPDGLKISDFAEVIGNVYENPELLEK